MGSGYGFLQRLVFAFQNCVSDAAAVQADSFSGVIVTRDNVFHAVKAIVGIDYGDNRDAQFFSFNQSAFLVAGIDNENRVRQALSGFTFFFSF